MNTIVLDDNELSLSKYIEEFGDEILNEKELEK